MPSKRYLQQCLRLRHPALDNRKDCRRRNSQKDNPGRMYHWMTGQQDGPHLVMEWRDRIIITTWT